MCRFLRGEKRDAVLLAIFLNNLKRGDNFMKRHCSVLIMLVSFFLALSNASAEGDLAKQSQNPVGDMISLPFEYWHYEGMPNDSSADVVIAKPVYPVNIGKYNLINRFIIPYISVDANIDGSDLGNVVIPPTNVSENGLGNIQYQGFFSLAEPGEVIYGIGPVLDFPTQSDGLGSEKWSAGIAAVVLTMPGKWVIGALAQNMWSYAGPGDAPDVNKFLFQYFINYNLANGWYLSMTPIITANWEADSDSTWTIPVGGGIGKLHRFGNQPVDFKLQAYGYAEKPDFGPDWSMVFTLKFLFPK
ncbi:neuromedin U [Desulfosediminicola ganghwensis]|uniref:neuromedin U n=1 Tax=Desulfosediminicola ganghwensis TaxID=2569540 RepID=UPI0010AD8FF2|nr:neuromedin U [Desulfosediminicola ganghwensis]